MNLAVVIPTYNRKEYLRTLLNNLSNQNTQEKVKLIIVVVVDGSTDGTIEMLEKDFNQIHIVKGDGNWWWTKSVNEGIKYAQQKFNPNNFLLLNDDNEILPNYIQTILNISSQNPNSIIGSMTISIDKPHLISFAGTKKRTKPFLKRINYIKNFSILDKLEPKFKNTLLPTYGLCGRGTLIPSPIINKIGYLDERLVQYGSDDDYCLRTWKMGFPVYIHTGCQVLNHTNLTSQGAAFKKDKLLIFIKSFFNIYSVNSLKKTILFYWKHSIKILLPIVLLYVILGTFKSYYFNYKKN